MLSLSIIGVATCALTVSYARGGLSHLFRAKGAAEGKSEAGASKPVASRPAPGAYQNNQTPGRPEVTEERLSGRRISNDDAVKSADGIVVGKIDSLGEAEPGASGQKYYGHVKVSVLRTIKGRAAGETLDMSLKVQVVSQRVAEEVPRPGQEYIIFLNRPAPGVANAIKLLAANTRNLDHITSLAASAGNK